MLGDLNHSDLSVFRGKKPGFESGMVKKFFILSTFAGVAPPGEKNL